MFRHFGLIRVIGGRRFSSGRSRFSRSGWFVNPLLRVLPSNSLNQKQKNVFATRIGSLDKVWSLGDQLDQNFVTCSLMSGDQGFAFTFLPTIAICRRRCSLQFAFVPFVANSSAFRTATKGIGEATRPAFKDVLVDMIGT